MKKKTTQDQADKMAQATRLQELELLTHLAKCKGYDVQHVTRLDGFLGDAVTLRPDGGNKDKRRLWVFASTQQGLEYLGRGGTL